MPDVANAFLNQSRRQLRTEYLPKIAACLHVLPEADLWWRPNEASNSAGNLLLHLAGNLRQWIVSGLGGLPDTRRRAEEFEAPVLLPARQLLAELQTTVEAADRVLAGLAPPALQTSYRIQGRTVTGLEAVYHAVEHFAMHTGQIIYITKLRTGNDLHFYEADGTALRARWTGRSRDGSGAA